MTIPLPLLIQKQRLKPPGSTVGVSSEIERLQAEIDKLQRGMSGLPLPIQASRGLMLAERQRLLAELRRFLSPMIPTDASTDASPQFSLAAGVRDRLGVDALKLIPSL